MSSDSSSESSSDESSASSVGVTAKLFRSIGRLDNLSSSSSSSSSDEFDSDGSPIAGPSRKRARIIDSSDTDSDGSSLVRKVKVKGRAMVISESDDSDLSDFEDKSLPKASDKSRNCNLDSSSDSEGSEKCIICFKTLSTIVAKPSNCDHIFHPECITTWTNTSNTCPIDRIKYSEIIITQADGKVTRRKVKTPPPPEEDYFLDMVSDDLTFCEICGSPDREAEMLLCDRCESGFHMDCLDPPLRSVPIDDWFCPSCGEVLDELQREVDDIMRDGIVLGSRLRDRSSPRTRGIRPRTRAGLRALNAIRMQAALQSAPSRSNSRRNPATSRQRSSTTGRRKKSKRKRRNTRYKVELVTTEDGATVEVKVAIAPRIRKKGRKKKSKYSKRARHGKPKRIPGNREESATVGSGFHIHSLDLFGSRPTLDYFSGCETEEDVDDFGGGVSIARRARNIVRGVADRKLLAARLFRSTPRPRVIESAPAVDVLSTIMAEQETFFRPPSQVHKPTSLTQGAPVRTAPGNHTDGQGNGTASMVSSQAIESNGQNCSQSASGSTLQASSTPLQPPPQPPALGRLYEEEDIDLYGDIEPPTCRLAPPPEPPPLLLAMDGGEEGGSSPEDTMLVIDDQPDAYDPDQPTSPPSPDGSKEKKDEKATASKKGTNNHDELLKSIKLPSPKPSEDLAADEIECPNMVMYSKTSRSIARRNSSDEEGKPTEGSNGESKNDDESKSPKVMEESLPSEMERENIDEECNSSGSSNLDESEGGQLNGENGEENIDQLEADDENLKSDDKENEKEQEGDVLVLGCEEGDRDGLVDITDEEMSTYEKNWEMENKPEPGEKVGLEGLETEAISENEDTLYDETSKPAPEPVVPPPKEEGEIVVEEKVEAIAWKKLSKGTKERSYREKENVKDKPKDKKKDKKPKEKRKELERYDVRKLINDKPKKRKTDEFGRDISNSRSKSRSRSDTRVKRRRNSRERRYSRSRGRSKSRTRSRSRSRTRSRSRGRSWSRNKGRSRGRSKSRSRRKSRSRSLKRRRSESKKDKTRGRAGAKSKERKRRRKSSSSCSSCSCTSCERERRTSKKLTVIVPNKKASPPKKVKEKKKETKSPKERSRKDSKRRKADSPVPSKEVFTSGDNILVSVNFKASKSSDKKDGSKRKRDDDSRRKKDKGSKENQPLRSIVTTTVSVPSTMPKTKKKDKLNMKHLKPVAIIDLDQSPFREQTPSPKEVIILSDSDSDEKQKEETQVQQLTTGPKTPPEPHIKFSISAKPQMRVLSNPLLDSAENEEREMDEEETSEVSHKGPNTPPEPPVPYDPFEPTKSRSPTPSQEMDLEMDHEMASEPDDMQDRSPEPPKSVTPQKATLPNDSPKTPSPLHSPPKPPEELLIEKPKPPVYTPSMSNNCAEELEPPAAVPVPVTVVVSGVPTVSGLPLPIGPTTSGIGPTISALNVVGPPVLGGGGDSPYSPGSSEGDDLFEPPMPQISTPTPIAKVKPRPIPPQKHSTPMKMTPSPLKKRPNFPPLPLNNKPPQLKLPKAISSKKEIIMKLDEDHLKILDDLPNSAVEMQVKDKYLKKLNRQERVVEEVKLVLKPHYTKKHVTKEEYKDILRKAVPKICHNKSGEINPLKIQHLIEAYVKKYRHKRKKASLSLLAPNQPSSAGLPPLNKPKQKTMWC